MEPDPLLKPIREAVILAGGLGTRLRNRVPDLPKCLAPVGDRPFLFYVINYLRSQGVEKFIFSLGYKHELIEAYLNEQFDTLDYSISLEPEPLGTGGAIRRAIGLLASPDILIANGDTLFKADLQKAMTLHLAQHSACTILLKPMISFDRYGVVETDISHRVTAFREKKYYSGGNINGGLYLLNSQEFMFHDWPDKFSFEIDFLEKYCSTLRLYGLSDNGYFIDIGVPADYEKANKDLQRPPLNLGAVDKSWTLFIDRDGVINIEKPGGYIESWNEFRFCEGSLSAMKKLAALFGKIIVVSNQRGVGRALMTKEELDHMHQRMEEEIQKVGGRIDGIYYCTKTDDKEPDRKPNPGMAFRAMRELPGIDPARSIMLGNKESDMRFARNAGLGAVFLATTHPETPFPHPDIDLRFDSLADFANSL